MARMASLVLVLGLTIGVGALVPARTQGQERAPSTGPTIDELISLKRPGTPAMSPDGSRVAFVIREANWEENAFETELWIADVKSRAVRQLTNGPRSSSAPAWSLDGTQLAFVSDRSGRRQIYTIDPLGGEASPITSSPESIGEFKWSPDGARIAFTSPDASPDELSTRSKRYGDFEVVDQEHRMTHLHVVDLPSKTVRRLTRGAFVVGSFEWSPDGAEIAFDHQINPDANNTSTADISIVNVATGEMRPLVTQSGPDTDPHWSPDGSRLVFVSAMANPAFTYANRRLAATPSAGGAIQNLSANFDESPDLVAWQPSGIYFAASQRTWSFLFRLDPTTVRISRLAPAERSIGSDFSLARDGTVAALIAIDPGTFREVSVLDLRSLQQRNVTDFSAQTRRWPQPLREVVTWTSKDGTSIEGVLHKPANFQTGRPYPLLVIIHGGPIGTSRPVPYAAGGPGGGSSAYPLEVWLAKGALVLEPNYRGSSGYGERFRSLNVRNLGVGDAWDVLSGVDYLVQSRIVDPQQVGVMGWSQGGFITAFLAAHDGARFKAASVGAGISDWRTYYTNTDVHRFTRQYLQATPWDDPEIYARASPITYIKGASTPTLIQHGATDRRVPLANAFELYQGLQDTGVTTTLIVYRGFDGLGHAPTRPRSSRALMEHNLNWFDRFLFRQN